MSILVSSFTITLGVAQQLEIARAEDREFRLAFTTDGTTPVDLTGATAIVMTVRDRAGTFLFARSYSGFQSVATLGVVRFQVLQADTADYAADYYNVDVTWTDASGYKAQLLAASQFLILPRVGEASDPLTTPPAVPVVYGIQWGWASGAVPMWTGKSGGYNLNDGVQAYDGSLGATAISTFRAHVQGVTHYPVTGTSQILASGWAYIGQHGGAVVASGAGGGALSAAYLTGGGNGGTGNALGGASGAGFVGMSTPVELNTEPTGYALDLYAVASDRLSRFRAMRLGTDADGVRLLGYDSGGIQRANYGHLEARWNDSGGGEAAKIGYDPILGGVMKAEVLTVQAGVATSFGQIKSDGSGGLWVKVTPSGKSAQMTSSDGNNGFFVRNDKSLIVHGALDRLKIDGTNSDVYSPNGTTYRRVANGSAQTVLNGTARVDITASGFRAYAPNGTDYLGMATGSARMVVGGSAGGWVNDGATGFKWKPDSDGYMGWETADGAGAVRLKNGYAEMVVQSTQDGFQVANGEAYLKNGGQISVAINSGSTTIKAGGAGSSIELVKAAKVGTTGYLSFYGQTGTMRPTCVAGDATGLHAALVALGLITA